MSVNPQAPYLTNNYYKFFLILAFYNILLIQNRFVLSAF